MSEKAPPSAPERDQLVKARKRDLPRLAPAPAPKGMGRSADPALEQARRNAAVRETRIGEINRSLNANRQVAKRSFNRDR